MSDNSTLHRAGAARRAGVLALLALAGAGHVGYPITLAALTAGRRDPSPPPLPDPAPGVTVLIAAYLEASVIAERIRNCRADGYPGPLEILVVADDAATAEAAGAAGATVLTSPHRRGKSAAIAEGLLAATHDLVVLTDANASFVAGSIEHLIRWFADPTVGAVAGDKRVTTGTEGIYWRFESWLKRRENRLGTTIALLGECAAVRTAGLPALRSDVVVDDFWLGLDVISSGRRVVYEPEAVACEPAPATRREDWERRTRVVGGAISLLWQRPEFYDVRRPVVLLQLWGHRQLRQTLGPAAHVVLLAIAVRGTARRSPRPAAAVVLAAHAAAAAGWALGPRAPAPARAAGQVLYLQAVALGGMARVARRRLSGSWPKAAR